MRNKYPNKVKVFEQSAFEDDPSLFVTHRCGSCHWLPDLDQIIRKVLSERHITEDMLGALLADVVQNMHSIG